MHTSRPDLLTLPATNLFGQVPEAQAGNWFSSNLGEPRVIRQLASAWPATASWSFDYLARLAGRRVVRLVAGNRERGPTAFVHAPLADYFRELHQGRAASVDEPALYLKEFDLLRELPLLKADVRPDGLFPRHRIVSSSAWIGPAGAHTGLHHDYLDNLAVLLRGRKRFFLARPGTVEAQRAVSRKFDRWARLSSTSISELASRGLAPGSLYAVDLAPGDALYLPRGWWHEVVNAEASIFLSGFFGSYPRVLCTWAVTGLRQIVHDAQASIGPTVCTCHPQSHSHPHPSTP